MVMPLDPATLPRKVVALRDLLLQREAEHAAEAQQQTSELERQAAELQAARNGLQEQVLRNEQLKVRLARLLRERFGASSEKLRGAIEQLELVLEDLEEQLAETAPPPPEQPAPIHQNTTTGYAKAQEARTEAGVLGELHPTLLAGSWSAFELDLATLFETVSEPVLYRDVISYPSVRQDIALVVDEEVPVGELLELVRAAAGEELREVKVFDVYRGEQIGTGRKSVALALAYQSAERTLTEAEANEQRERIVAAAAARLGATLRS